MTLHGDAMAQRRAQSTVDRRQALHPANQMRSRRCKHRQEATVSRIRWPALNLEIN